MFLAIIDTSRSEFYGVGTTRGEAVRMARAALLVHAEQIVAPLFGRAIPDEDVKVIDLRPGMAYRDGEALLPRTVGMAAMLQEMTDADLTAYLDRPDDQASPLGRSLARVESNRRAEVAR